MAQHINLTDSLADSLANMHRDNVEQFEAKLQEIFDLNKPTFVEQHTYKQMLNDFTLYKAYNMMYEIVEKVENDRVYTIEGNSSDSCRQRDYDINSMEIQGYGTPMY